MTIRLEMGNWIVDDKFFITEGIKGYEVYNCGADEDEKETKELFSSTSFEECLVWIWNS